MKICVIDNMAPHYRNAIFLHMDKEYDVNWVFGEAHGGIKELDISLLKNAKISKTRHFPIGYYINDTVKLVDHNDIIITDGNPKCISTWFLLLRNKILRRNRRIYFWAHGWYGKEGLLKKTIKKIFFGLGTGVLAYNNYARGLMIQNGFDPKKIKVIHNSLDYDQQLEIRKILKQNDIYTSHFKNNNPVLMFIGRLTKVKRLDILLDALQKLKVANENYNLVFIGNGPERTTLERLTTDLGLNENVWFYGECYDEKLNAELIFNADLCVAPGNVGLTAIHSLMFGCPVATHNQFQWQMPEFETIRDGRNGFFFERDDVQDLANNISLWFKRTLNRRDEIRTNCYKEIDENWNPIYQMKVLREVLN